MSNLTPLPDLIPKTLSLTTPPDTDIWRKPPFHDAFNAPIQYVALPLGSLKSARVTVKAEWKTRFDQGGLCLVLPNSSEGDGHSGDGKGSDKVGGGRRWVKTGVEFMEGKAHVSTVACDRWADWSLRPMASGDEVTVQMEREVVDGKRLSTLWVYMLDGQSKIPLREISWVFEHEDVECWLGIYAAKPTKDEDDAESELKVEFKDLVIERF